MDSECLGGRWGSGGSVPTSAPLPRLLEVMVAGYPVLLVRNRREFRALGSKCPHYGAPLSKGNPSLGQGGKSHLGEAGSHCPAWGGGLLQGF